MAWRDDLIQYVENGNVEGALRIFDELWADRKSVRELNMAYLQLIGGKLDESGGKPALDEVTLRVQTADALEKAFAGLTAAVQARVAG